MSFNQRVFPIVTAAAMLLASCGGSASVASTSASTPASAGAAAKPASSAAAKPASAAPGSAKPAASAAAAPAGGGSTFQAAIGIDPDVLDPEGQTTTTVANLVDYVVEPLVKLDQDGKVQPALATKWDTSTDGLTYTFHLRDNVKFQDGEPFNADAVKKTYDRVLDPKVTNPQRAPYLNISKVEVVDPMTVKFTLKQPFPPFLQAMTQTNGAIISPKSLTEHGNTYEKYVFPVGTGPYNFKQWVKSSQVSFTKFAGYWGDKPYYDNVVFRVVPEAATRESLLLAGQVQMIILPPINDLPALKNNSAVKVLMGGSDREIFISMDTQKAPLNDVKVRQAFNYAVDKNSMVKNILFGAADVTDSIMAPSLVGYSKVGPYQFDANKAKQLLSEAHWNAGTKLKFVSPTGRYSQDFQASQAISGFLKDVGVQADLGTSDWPTYLATINVPPAKASVNMHLLGWAPGYLDASQMLVQFRTDTIPPKGLNTSYCCTEEITNAIKKADSNPNQDERLKEYAAVEKQIWDYAPWIFLWVQKFPIAYSSKVTNISSIPTEKFAAIYAKPA